jgi:hypothetical protein
MLPQNFRREVDPNRNRVKNAHPSRPLTASKSTDLVAETENSATGR